MCHYLCLFFFVISIFLNAQDINTKWFNLNNTNKAIPPKIIGANTNYIYTIDPSVDLDNSFSSHLLSIPELKINAIEKSKQQTKKSLDLDGKIVVDKKKITLNFLKIIVLERKLLVFWINNLRKSEDIFVQTISIDLETSSEIKQIFTFKTATYGQPKSYINTTILNNPLLPNQFIIGGEKEAEMFKKIPFEYSILDSNLTLIKTDTVITPAVLVENQKGNALSYRLEADGKIYGYASANIKVYLSPASRIIIINPETNQSVSKVFNAPMLYDFNYCWHKNKISIIGWLDEMKEEEERLRYTGIYFAELDIENLKLITKIQQNFNKPFLQELFKNNPDEIKSETRSWHTEDERAEIESTLNPYFEIEKFIHVDTNGVLIVASKNWMQLNNTIIEPNAISIPLSMNQPGLIKENLISFYLQNTNGLKWKTNIYRRAFYPFHAVRPDIIEIEKNKSQYLFYGNRKNKDEVKSMIDYTSIELENGKLISKNLDLGAPGKLSDIQKIDNRIYFTSFEKQSDESYKTYFGEIIIP